MAAFIRFGSQIGRPSLSARSTNTPCWPTSANSCRATQGADPAGLVYARPRRLHLHGAVREHRADGIELADLAVELGPLVRVLDGRLHRGLRDPERLRGDADATAAQRRERHAVAFIDFTKKT